MGTSTVIVMLMRIVPSALSSYETYVRGSTCSRVSHPHFEIPCTSTYVRGSQIHAHVHTHTHAVGRVPIAGARGHATYSHERTFVTLDFIHSVLERNITNVIDSLEFTSSLRSMTDVKKKKKKKKRRKKRAGNNFCFMFVFRLNALNGVARDTLSFNGQLKPLSLVCVSAAQSALLYCRYHRRIERARVIFMVNLPSGRGTKCKNYWYFVRSHSRVSNDRV
ncbi:hypothetical protein PUN28_011634 [Cardiocondyla obscurior]|uniref:Secreted protein n=1 Tax=Cardiocondyla obscurior TaxID=286306 RepID=A0AAW2FGA0_9HYME